MTASVPKNPLVEVILVPFAVPKVRLVELKVSANALVEVKDPPVAVVKDKAPVLKLVEVALVRMVLPRLERPETLKLVEVTLVPARLMNERLVEVSDVPFAVPNERFCAKKFAVAVALVKIAVEAPVAPIAVLLMVPPSMVKPLTTKSSVIEFEGKVIEPVALKFVVVMFEPSALVNASPVSVVSPNICNVPEALTFPELSTKKRPERFEVDVAIESPVAVNREVFTPSVTVIGVVNSLLVAEPLLVSTPQRNLPVVAS